MTNDNVRQQFSELVGAFLLNDGRRTYQDFADECALPEYGMTFTRQAVWKWVSGKQAPPLENCRLWAMYGATERAREFGRRGLAIYGLRLVEG